MVKQRQEKLSEAQIQHNLVMDASQLPRLFDVLRMKGYEIIGPTVRDGTVVYDHIDSTEDLPIGYVSEQSGGTYRLRQTSDCAFFGYGISPHSWKNLLYPSSVRLWQAKRQQTGFAVIPENDKPPKYAFVGVRPCELAAIAIQDQVLLKGEYVDPIYKARRKENFIVVVNCGSAADTCFCTSMNTGPRAKNGFDLCLTELIHADRHEFLVEVGSTQGEIVVQEMNLAAAVPDDLVAAERVVEATVHSIKRQLDTDNLPELLKRNTEHPRWDDVAARCLTCGNCTMVCPTCFCTAVEDVTDLTGQTAEHWRKWDSCFTVDFSYIHGGSVRSSVKSRYRQWLTHKLSSWVDQFGTFGCVGCGRCITWCPVGIDLIQEVEAIRDSNREGSPAPALESSAFLNGAERSGTDA